MRDVVLVSAVRTPIGKFLGSLKDFAAPELGAIVVREAVRRAGIDPASADECIMGNVVSAGEGQNPAHFARQLVRFLRNALVAKVSGKESSLLQISGDERTRVARVADMFSEEDLARHLQIMLRTFNELGYRQEQRFHLELGLLKMAHAQRLLPLEQLLSEAGAATTPSPTPPTI